MKARVIFIKGVLSKLMSLKIIFMGTPTFALPTLQELLNSSHKICGVYTQPPRPKGRGHKLQKSSVHILAEQAGIPVFTPTTLRDAAIQQQFMDLKADIGVVVAYGLILPQAILDAPIFGCLNVHGSLLPRWRGAAPLQRALLADDKLTGITIMKMDKGLDTGPMLTSAPVTIAPHTTLTMLHDVMAELGGKLLEKTLSSYVKGEIIPQSQVNHGITYADKITKGEGIIDWNQPSSYIERQICALTPWPGATFEHEGQHFKIWEAVAEESSIKALPGTIYGAPLTVKCGQGALRIQKLQRAGGTPLAIEDFVRGFDFPIGLRLLCPAIN